MSVGTSRPVASLALFVVMLLVLPACAKRADVAKPEERQPTSVQALQTQASPAAPGISRPTAAPPSSPSSSYTSSLRTKEEETVTAPAPVPEPPAKGAPSAGPTGLPAPGTPLKDIFFDFDKSDIRDDARANLSENLQWLRAHPSVALTIEGHCDERGTAEYNLALGERRAKAAKDFFLAGGVDPKRIATISYGKERPFVLGHDESAWKWNRRAHFVMGEAAKQP
jgi:peptidoglycan-associated lipoprotein